MSIIEPYPKPRVREQLEHGPVKFNQVFFSQPGLLDKETGAPQAPPYTIGPPSDRAQIDRGDPAALALLKLKAELLTLA